MPFTVALSVILTDWVHFSPHFFRWLPPRTSSWPSMFAGDADADKVRATRTVNGRKKVRMVPT